VGTNIVNWERSLREKWRALNFGDVRVTSNDEEHNFEVDMYLDGIEPTFVRVELYADGVNGDSPVRQEMTFMEKSEEAEPNWVTYRTSVMATRPLGDFTPRIMPKHDNVNVPLELDLIRWQR
jgi:starch phosphorylase